MFNDQPVDIERKSGQWLGATLHTTGNSGKVVVSLTYTRPAPPVLLTELPKFHLDVKSASFSPFQFDSISIYLSDIAPFFCLLLVQYS